MPDATGHPSPANGHPPSPPAPLLRATAVAFRYPQHERGSQPISLAVAPGECLLITGPSGCGKSTLARCLTGLIPHLYRGSLEGHLCLDGLVTSAAPLWELSERAGLVFQNPASQMLAGSVEQEILFGLENLGLSVPEIHSRLEAALARFGLQALRHRVPQTLSGGEQQKLALAAITARRPALLVLDEPLSMLDSTAASDLMAHLADLAADGTAVVICEHREEYARALPALRTLHLPPATAGGTQRGCSPLPPAAAGGTQRGCSSPLPPAAAGGIEGGCSPPQGVLHVSGLTVQLGGQPILRDLSCAFSPGQVTAIVGRNGVGKTTLLRALVGLQEHSGTVLLDGSPPDLGLVFHNADLQLFNASVRDEILYRLRDPDLELYAWLLDLLGLGAYEQTPPLLLSEGEKKRTALATVLMRQPRHGILLDEPSLGQDRAHKACLMRLAHAVAQAGQIVILTTHDLTLAARADRLLLLGPAGFVADGPPAQVLDQQDAWAELGLAVPDWVRPEFEQRSPEGER